MEIQQKQTFLEIVAKIIFALYVLLLLWLVLFKFSYDILSVLSSYNTRNFNFLPSLNISREMVENIIIFIPFGLFLSVNFKYIALWQKLALIAAFSFSVEAIQYIFAIGVTDTTDFIANTIGGLLGLLAYDTCKKYIDSRKIDWCIIIVGVALALLLLSLRIFILRVRY